MLHLKTEIVDLFPGGESPTFWLDQDVGELVARERNGRELRRIETDDGTFFLKRGKQESLLKHLRMLLFGRLPQSGAVREVRMLEALRAAGFATMEPVVWGQKRLRGFRVRGFLLVREVDGEEVADLFKDLPTPERSVLMRQVGELIGRLHANGFFHPVRLKDLFSTDDGLVLIDRETSKPWPARFWCRKCPAALVRCLRRTLRDGFEFRSADIRAFLRGYRAGVLSRWEVAPVELAGRVFAAVRQDARS